MDFAEARGKLEAASIKIKAANRNGNDNGWRVVCENGAIVNCFDTGNVNIQGKNQAPVKTALFEEHPSGESKAAPQATPVKPASRAAFVVYGHDEKAGTELEAMLRRWDVEPLILDQLPSGGQTLIEKLESVRKDACFGVILATPDDEGHKAGRPDEMAFRARQNVVLELGMLLTLLGRAKVAILIKSDVQMERPSDIQGLIYIPFKDSVADAGVQLAKEMHAQGMHIDLGRL